VISVVKRAAWIVLTLTAGAAVVPTVAGAQELITERLFLLPAQVDLGPGTVRLDGMGGFEAVVPDENYEIDLYDFSRNPAGFGDDRDSWSIDTRYSHKELTERDARSTGNDVKINDGSLLIGYHAPGDMGVGGRIDYAKVQALDVVDERDDFTVTGLVLIGSRYFTDKLTLGANLSRTSEDENTFSPSIYNISHNGGVTRAGLGAGYHLAEGVVIGARGEIFSTQLDGESRGPFHTDTFNWSRPGGTWAVQGFVDRGRLHAGADFSRQKLQGDESVHISWSQRFVYNPTDENVSLNLDTFTEDRVNKQFRGRARLDVVPGQVTVGAAVLEGREDFKVLTNPNAIGSQVSQDVNAKSSAYVGGVSWVGVQSRLLVAAEAKVAKTDVTSYDEAGAITNSLDDKSIRVGGEYLLGETLVGRLGLIRSRLKQDYEALPDRDGSFNTTTLATGIGVVPAGGIWQFDFAYDVDVQADLNVDRSRFSAYVKYLF
jgi:hypothetical protein